MKPLQSYIALITTYVFLTTTFGLQGCGAKEATSANQPQSATASTQDPSSVPQPGSAPSGQPSSQDQSQAQAPAQAQAPVQLPEVNFTADGLDELLAPVALYPIPFSPFSSRLPSILRKSWMVATGSLSTRIRT